MLSCYLVTLYGCTSYCFVLVIVVVVARVARIKVLNFYIRFCIVLNVGFAALFETETGVSKANAEARDGGEFE